jgi:hypothetical protein
MPYSNQRRHNSPSIPQTPYQTLIIPCPNFDPIYQVILLENSNEWNLSPAKEGSLKKKRGARIEKQKWWNLTWKAPGFKKKRGWDLQAAGRDSIKRKKERGSHRAKSDVWPHPYPHIICICTTFYSFIFPFLPPFTTPFSMNHDYLPHKLSIIFLCFLQYTRCSIGTSWEWTTTKILAKRKRVTGRMSDWVTKLEKTGR